MNDIHGIDETLPRIDRIGDRAVSGRFRRYPELSQTSIPGIRSIPSHWRVEKLKHISSIRFSNVDKHSVNGEIPVRLCNYVDVYYNDSIIAAEGFMEATATPSEIERFSLKKGDVLITKDSESWDDIAVPSYVKFEMPRVLCGYHLAHIRPQRQVTDGAFLGRAFAADGVRDQFRMLASGITRYGLSKHGIENALFPIPPLPEQQAIANFLDRETTKIDALIAKKRHLIELLQEKREAVITKAVTTGLIPDTAAGKPAMLEWIDEVPAHWHLCRLGHLVAMEGGSTPNKDNPDYWNGDIPWVSPKDMYFETIHDSKDHVSERAIRETGLRLIQPPVVLHVVRGMILAHSYPVSLSSIPITINQDMKALRPKPIVTPEYLRYLLRGIRVVILGKVEDSAHGTKVLRTNLWKSIEVFVPDKKEQQSICDTLDRHTSDINCLIRKVETALRLLQEYRAALVSAAVTGKIDVRNQ